jgi:hypothetical protein
MNAEERRKAWQVIHDHSMNNMVNKFKEGTLYLQVEKF